MEIIPGVAFLPPDEGEETVLRFLQEQLGDRAGTILTNVYVPDRDGKPSECDIIVINENGVYDLEVKNWYGSLFAYDGEWRVHNGESRGNPTAQATHNAAVIHGYLKSEGLSWVSVCGLAVMARGLERVTYAPGYRHEKWEFGLDERLIEALTGRAYVRYPTSRALDTQAVQRVSDLLRPSPTQRRPMQIAGFGVSRVLGDRGYYTELEGYDVEMPGRSVRIKAYRLPPINTVPKLAEAVERFKREVTALYDAGEHENLVRPILFTRDLRTDNGYFLILEHRHLKTLAEVLRQQGPLPSERQRAILRDTAAGLAFCHGKGFVHRNLSPDAIYLTREGRAKIGDFDLVRFPGYGLTVTAGRARALLNPRHVAPEQMGDIHDVDARADIYALGAVWYDLLFNPERDEPLHPTRIDHAPLGLAAKNLLRSMLAIQRDARPPNMAAVLHQLAALPAD